MPLRRKKKVAPSIQPISLHFLNGIYRASTFSDGKNASARIDIRCERRRDAKNEKVTQYNDAVIYAADRFEEERVYKRCNVRSSKAVTHPNGKSLFVWNYVQNAYTKGRNEFNAKFKHQRLSHKKTMASVHLLLSIGSSLQVNEITHRRMTKNCCTMRSSKSQFNSSKTAVSHTFSAIIIEISRDCRASDSV